MPRVLHTLDLFVPEPATAPLGAPKLARVQEQLWLAIHLPRLALECFASTASEPAVVVDGGGRSEVIACNDSAYAAGVAVGMRLGTAMTLAARLEVFERDSCRERVALERLAAWAHRFTSMVSIEPPNGVLLEVSGSVRLFGALGVIKRKVREALARRYRAFELCVAPTPTAASWLARGGGGDVLSWHEVGGRLGALPLSVTRWPRPVQALLEDLGLRTLGDCVRLPRQGFARRVGHAYLRELDRAFGWQFDLRAEFEAPKSWSAKIELPEESVDGALLLAASEQLIDALILELDQHQAQIGYLELVYEHLHHSPTIESFDLLEPTHERDRLLPLLSDRLERRILPVPVTALRMASGIFTALERSEPDLFERKPLDELVQSLLERLRVRFGVTAVHGVRTVAEHRPERAWARHVEFGGARAAARAHSASGNARPLWLLPEPVPLSSANAQGRPTLELCSGPERIESGWWDEQDVGRDYYTAKNSQGQKLWVFRDRRSASWFLHGLFG
jgi:protein ImuB